MMQPPSNPADDVMATDAPNGESQLTQQTQQETQPASQPEVNMDHHLWGCLLPCSAALNRIDFHRIKHTYNVGRNQQDDGAVRNNVVLPGKKISNFHCRINWDGREGKESAVRVTDLSSNGTFINGRKIGKNKTMLLFQGNEIAFGTPQPQTDSQEDFRFVYRHFASGAPPTGLWAHYQIHGELGKGSFATVFKALHTETAQWFAVKVMQRQRLQSASGNTTGETAFAREIKILEDLKHPNICQLKEVFYEDHTVNLVLEYVEGGDLLEYIVKRRHLDEPESQYLTYQICDALAYIHSKNIAHRDLKPENVLLTNTNPPQVRVADFGLAKAVDSLTFLRTMCGTPCYLAPEVVLQTNNSGYDNVVDSWSVGVIVYCMLTGHNPFPDDDAEMTLQDRIRSRTVDWVTFRGFGTPVAENFVRRLLEPVPSQRMTASAAREHPWLAVIHATSESARREPTASPEPDEEPYDASMDTMNININGVAYDDAVSPTANLAGADGEGDALMDEESADDALDVGSQRIPGAFPHSQLLTRQSSQLQRRSQVILSQQEERAQSEGEEDQELDQEQNGRTGRKRKLVFEGSLTPLEEDGDDHMVADGPSELHAGQTVKRRFVKRQEATTRRRKAQAAREATNIAGPSRGVRRSSRLNSPVKATRKR